MSHILVFGILNPKFIYPLLKFRMYTMHFIAH